MDDLHNTSPTASRTQMPKGTIQFSTAGKTKHSTPKSSSTQISIGTSLDQNVTNRSRMSSVYNNLSFANIEYLNYSTGGNDLTNKYLNHTSRFDFKPRETHNHKKNNKFHNLSKFTLSPLLSTSTSDSIQQNHQLVVQSIPIIGLQQELVGSNPESKHLTQKPKIQFNLNKHRSSIKIGLHSHSKEDFLIGKRLGKGNFGDVFLAKHKITGFLFALKVIPKRIVTQKGMEKQLLWQAAINMTLNHPFITQMFGMFDDHENVYFIQQLMTDGNLHNKMKQTKRFKQQQATPIVKGILGGVEYMHRKSIIHRDLKPQNIFTIFGIHKIGDFGWAIYTPDLLRETFCGTPLYMSPEILKGQKYDSGVDNWALGILTYELLIGRPPFKISSAQQLKKIITEQIKFPEYITVSQRAKDFILKLLNKDAEQRIDLDVMLQHPFIENHKQEISLEFRNLFV